jgi:hypothetical protein
MATPFLSVAIAATNRTRLAAEILPQKSKKYRSLSETAP